MTFIQSYNLGDVDMIDVVFLKTLLEKRRYSEIKEELLKYDAFDISETLKKLNGSYLILLYRFSSKESCC